MADNTAAELKIIIAAQIAQAQEDLDRVGEDVGKMGESFKASSKIAKKAIDGIKRSVEELKADMADLKDAVVSVKLHDKEAKTGIDDVKAEIDSIPNDTTARIRADVTEALAKVQEFKAELDTIPKDKTVALQTDGAGAGVAAGAAKGGGGLAGALIASVIPAASPLGATAIAGGMGLASAIAPAAAGSGGLAAVSIADLKPVLSAVSQYKKDLQAAMSATTTAQYRTDIVKSELALRGLAPAQRQAAQALLTFEGTWQNFATAFQKPVFNLFEQALKSIETLMTDMKPVINASAGAFTTLFAEMNKGLNSSDNKQFFQWLAKTAGPAITAFGHVAANVFRGIANLLMAFSPAAKSMEQGLVRLSSDFYKWTDSLAGTKGFKEFLQYASSSGKSVLNLIGNLAGIVGTLLKDMAPLGLQMVKFVSALAGVVKNGLQTNPVLKTMVKGVLGAATGILKLATHLLTLNPKMTQFALGIAAVVTAGIGLNKLLGPFRNMGKAVTDFIPKIGEMAGKDGLVGKLGKSMTGLIPGFKAVGKGLSFIGGPWGILIGAVAVGVLEIVKHWKQITSWVKKHFGIDIPAVMNRLGTIFNRVWRMIKDVVAIAMYHIKPTILNTVKAIEVYWKQVWPEIQKVFQEVWHIIKPILNVVFKMWKTELHAFFGFVKGAWKPFWAAIGDVLKASWALMKGTLKIAWDAISGLFKVFLDILTGKWGKAWDDLKSTITNVWKDIKGMFTSFLTDAEDFGKNIILSIVDGIKGAVSGAEKDLQSVWNGFKSFFGFGGSSPSTSLGPNVQSIQPSATATSWPASTVPSTGGSPIYNTTIHVSGNVTKNEQELANKVASAQMAAMKRTTKVG